MSAIDYALILLALSLVPITLFLVFYVTRSNWTANRLGRIIVAKTVSIWFVIALVTYIHFFGTFPLYGILVFGVPIFTFIGYTAQFVSLLKIQSGKREEMFQPPWWTRVSEWVRRRWGR